MLSLSPSPYTGTASHHAITAIIERVASDFCHSQYITPPFQPFFVACFTHEFNVSALMYPFAAPAMSSGFPMTILLNGTDE